MKKILFLLLVFTALLTFSQTLITGTVIDKETQQPLEFAEVILLTKESSVVTGVVTSVKGEFDMKVAQGTYQIQIIFVGQTLFTKELIVTVQPINLNKIEVTTSEELEEIVIDSKKKLIQRKIDRLVFNVENSSKSSEGDALEVLRVTPGVRVQNDEITMIGKSNLRVLINDKIVQLSSEELTAFLKSIASEDIKNIEVITTPPAKYEAAGNSGLINITLKQAKRDSWNAQLKSLYRQRTFGSSSFGGNFNLNKNKFSVATSFNYSDDMYFQEQDDYAFFPDGLWYTSSPITAGIERINARIDLNYEITPHWEMGGQYLYNSTDFDVTDAPYTPVFDYATNEIIRSLASDGTMRFTPEIHSINYNNEITLDTLGRKITVNLDYFTYNNPDTKTYNGVSVISDPFSEQFYRGINTNSQDVTNVSAKIDIEYPLSWINVNLGGKITNSKNTNTILFFNSGLVDNPVNDLPLSENDFNYNEDIFALYVSFSKKFNDKWSGKFGLRMEETKTDSQSDNLAIFVENDYNRLFPTFYLSYDASENSNFSFNYSKRIQRPSFGELNPNIYFSSPFQSIEGNAFLQPAFIDNIELTNTYKNFVTKIYYSLEDNLFSQVPLADVSTNIIRFTNENFIDTQRFGISENYTFDKIKWWSSNNSLDVNYVISKFNLEEQQPDQKGINATISSYNDFNLNVDKTWLMGVNYWYTFPGINGVFNTKSASSLSFSLQHLMLDKNLNISLRATDIFKTSAERNESTVNGVFQTARYYYDSRSLQLSIRYKFGNTTIKAKKHATGNKDERSRTGN